MAVSEYWEKYRVTERAAEARRRIAADFREFRVTPRGTLKWASRLCWRCSWPSSTPGLNKDANCAGLLTTAKAQGAPVKVSAVKYAAPMRK